MHNISYSLDNIVAWTDVVALDLDSMGRHPSYDLNTPQGKKWASKFERLVEDIGLLHRSAESCCATPVPHLVNRIEGLRLRLEKIKGRVSDHRSHQDYQTKKLIDRAVRQLTDVVSPQAVFERMKLAYCKPFVQHENQPFLHPVSCLVALAEVIGLLPQRALEHTPRVTLPCDLHQVAIPTAQLSMAPLPMMFAAANNAKACAEQRIASPAHLDTVEVLIDHPDKEGRVQAAEIAYVYAKKGIELETALETAVALARDTHLEVLGKVMKIILVLVEDQKYGLTAARRTLPLLRGTPRPAPGCDEHEQHLYDKLIDRVDQLERALRR